MLFSNKFLKQRNGCTLHFAQGIGKDEFDQQRVQLLCDEVKACVQACEKAALILFNLFSCEGFFIAQHLEVPCVALSPFVVTRLGAMLIAEMYK